MSSHAIDNKYRSRYESTKTVQLGSSDIAILLGVFNETIIPPALVGYETVIANEARSAPLAIYHLISNVHSWNNC